MLVEVAKPIALTLCMYCLYAVFCAAFLTPAGTLQQTLWDCLGLLSLAAGICLTSGMIFRESDPSGQTPLMATLPVQLFCWATSIIVLLFVVSWYLETHCVFYRDIHRFKL